MSGGGTSQHTLGERAAFQLANVTKTPPQYGAIALAVLCAGSTGSLWKPARFASTARSMKNPWK